MLVVGGEGVAHGRGISAGIEEGRVVGVHEVGQQRVGAVSAFLTVAEPVTVGVRILRVGAEEVLVGLDEAVTVTVSVGQPVHRPGSVLRRDPIVDSRYRIAERRSVNGFSALRGHVRVRQMLVMWGRRGGRRGGRWWQLVREGRASTWGG